ncbi:MAG: hypothetical protein HOL15_06170 [Nitrospinaceae bacterium]|jgi:hypothetical protein|nr:hypothetical protein [Nitrospina sp.]MBT5376378.1 hypothetical protein [Nitrospinaceae bacterium]MBT5869921.1 hypothetical protein [Nitrospinaceae bacterium]MBT6345157.1 hypothetical protein [Nitrospina sp.]
MTNVIIIFIHLSAAGVALGSLVFCLKIYLPMVEDKKVERNENSPSYKVLDLLTPTVFACMLALVGTGVYFLLENYSAQVGLKPGYYNLFGIKMVFVAGAFFASMYSAFSLRIHISDLDLNPGNKKLVPQTLKKMIGLSKMTLWMVAIATFLGIWLARY